jgi:hypothetical protein
MKKIAKLGLYSILLLCLSAAVHAQDVNADGEMYIKRNIALTNFKFLGVNARQYAKCVESVNYLEQEKRLSYSVINKIEYADDGENYDLVAGDGIMTSTSLFEYTSGQTVIPPRQYATPKQDVLVHDVQNEHLQRTGAVQSKFKITIACDVHWRPCSEWPAEHQSLCRRLTWPSSGNLVISNCRIEVSF